MASVHGAGWVGGGVVESHDTAAVLIGVLYKKNFVLAGCNFWWINLNQQKNEGGEANAQGCSVCLLELTVSLAQTVIWERAVKVS